jgi:hypothetical protein
MRKTGLATDYLRQTADCLRGAPLFPQKRGQCERADALRATGEEAAPAFAHGDFIRQLVEGMPPHGRSAVGLHIEAVGFAAKMAIVIGQQQVAWVHWLSASSFIG